MGAGRWFTLIRIGITLAAMFLVALLSAVVLGLVDLYLTGHSLPSLDREWISVPSLGITMSRSDVGLLATVSVTAVTAWVLIGWIRKVMASDGKPPSIRQG